MDLVRLQELLIAEVSGVDQPANELPGWMVAKSKGRIEQVRAAEKAKRAAERTILADLIRQEYLRGEQGRFTAAPSSSGASEPAPAALHWRHYGAVVQALRGR